MNEEIETLYEKIGEMILREIPEDYKKLWIYFRKYENSGDTMIYCQSQRDPHTVFGVSTSVDLGVALHDTFWELWEIQKNKGARWTTATFQLDDEGEFIMDYTYENISNVPIVKLNEEWKRKHLGNLKIRAKD